MAYRLVTCPDTAHLEMIEHVDHPLGLLIQSCSRFRPPCDIGCPRTCAARIDRRAQLDDDATADDDPADVPTSVDLVVAPSFDLALEIDHVRELDTRSMPNADDTSYERPRRVLAR